MQKRLEAYYNGIRKRIKKKEAASGGKEKKTDAGQR